MGQDRGSVPSLIVERVRLYGGALMWINVAGFGLC
jgi:hypothetical protein